MYDVDRNYGTSQLINLRAKFKKCYFFQVVCRGVQKVDGMQEFLKYLGPYYASYADFVGKFFQLLTFIPQSPFPRYPRNKEKMTFSQPELNTDISVHGASRFGAWGIQTSPFAAC